jgi:hypothetical protein
LLRIQTKISMSFSFQFFLVFLFLSILNKNNILLLNAFLAHFQNLFWNFRKKGLFIRISNDLFFEETDIFYRKVGNELFQPVKWLLQLLNFGIDWNYITVTKAFFRTLVGFIPIFDGIGSNISVGTHNFIPNLKL